MYKEDKAKIIISYDDDVIGYLVIQGIFNLDAINIFSRWNYTHLLSREVATSVTNHELHSSPIHYPKLAIG